MDLDRRELQCILNAINENIFFKDTNGRYVLSTHVCNMLNSNGDSDFSIYGKTDTHLHSMTADMNIMMRLFHRVRREVKLFLMTLSLIRMRCARLLLCRRY